MLLHHAYAVDPEVLHELLAAWTAARAAMTAPWSARSKRQLRAGKSE